MIVRHGLDPTAWERRHERGEVMDRTPYAYHLAEPAVVLEWSRDRAEHAAARWWRMSVKRLLGFDFVHVWRNRALIERADAVWTHTEREHLAVALLKVLRPRRYRSASIAQSVWLWDLWPTLSAPRRRFFRILLRRHDVEVVLSRMNRDASRAAVPGRTVVRVPFGTHFAQPAGDNEAGKPRRILVVGNDRHRDWDLMLRAATALPELDIDLLSLSENASARAWPPNVRIRGVQQADMLRTVYAAADVVALPLRPNLHASGCTVAIEALSAGLPVVAVDTGGIDEYLQDGDATLLPPGDADAFTAALADAAARGRRGDPALPARRGLSEGDYVARLVSITRSVLTRAPIPEAVQCFAPMDDERTPHHP
ncbi:glycosyltransferase [Microbacterium caowuchunii]|uniref:glycosyltransferase n=1 Tax=Microbacterium caowuchunii TaxID=2614638 RepID=UPI001CD63514|nr:glycosyltransferase [Microbacterium caowuchunii]